MSQKQSQAESLESNATVDLRSIATCDLPLSTWDVLRNPGSPSQEPSVNESMSAHTECKSQGREHRQC